MRKAFVVGEWTHHTNGELSSGRHEPPSTSSDPKGRQVK